MWELWRCIIYCVASHMVPRAGFLDVRACVGLYVAILYTLSDAKPIFVPHGCALCDI